MENLISSGRKALQILMSQELLNNTLYLITHIPDQEVKHEAIQTLDIIIDKTWNELDVEQKQKVWNFLCGYLMKNSGDAIALQSIYRILTVEEFQINEAILNAITKNVTKSDEGILAASLEILLIQFQRDAQSLSNFLDYFISNNMKLSQVINETFSSPKHYNASRHFLSFVASIMAMDVRKYLQYDDIVLNLKIPKMFEF